MCKITLSSDSIKLILVKSLEEKQAECKFIQVSLVYSQMKVPIYGKNLEFRGI
jgi:hypothetical protein